LRRTRENSQWRLRQLCELPRPRYSIGSSFQSFVLVKADSNSSEGTGLADSQESCSHLSANSVSFEACSIPRILLSLEQTHGVCLQAGRLKNELAARPRSCEPTTVPFFLVASVIVDRRIPRVHDPLSTGCGYIGHANRGLFLGAAAASAAMLGQGANVLAQTSYNPCDIILRSSRP
jgi:hypothetical protein